MHLGIVDQSPVPDGSTGADALRNTIDLACRAERFGYSRYWVAEHHNTDGLAGSAPEIMVGQIAAATEAIRVGSGGVMLSHYSSLKVAEQFAVLASLHPGRIDLGVGRAPGSDGLTAAALARGGTMMDARNYPNQLQELVRYLHDEMPADARLAGVRATPQPAQVAEPWLLASSVDSASFAAHFGLPLSWAHFITWSDGGPIVRAYLDQFQPSDAFPEPRANLAVSLVCGETDADAQRIASSVRYWRQQALRGTIPSIDAALAVLGSDGGKSLPTQPGRKPMIVGDPAQCREGIEVLASEHGVDEVLVVTITHRHEDRVRSYELLAAEFGLG